MLTFDVEVDNVAGGVALPVLRSAGVPALLQFVYTLHTLVLVSGLLNGSVGRISGSQVLLHFPLYIFAFNILISDPFLIMICVYNSCRVEL